MLNDRLSEQLEENKKLKAEKEGVETKYFVRNPYKCINVVNDKTDFESDF